MEKINNSQLKYNELYVNPKSSFLTFKVLCESVNTYQPIILTDSTDILKEDGIITLWLNGSNKYNSDKCYIKYTHNIIFQVEPTVIIKGKEIKIIVDTTDNILTIQLDTEFTTDTEVIGKIQIR